MKCRCTHGRHLHRRAQGVKRLPCQATVMVQVDGRRKMVGCKCRDFVPAPALTATPVAVSVPTVPGLPRESQEEIEMSENGSSPKEEAKAEYMRAKWARERTERGIVRIVVRIAEASGQDKRALSGSLKEAKSLLSERKTAEARAKAVYEAAKVAAKAPAKVEDQAEEAQAEEESAPVES